MYTNYLEIQVSASREAITFKAKSRRTSHLYPRMDGMQKMQEQFSA